MAVVQFCGGKKKAKKQYFKKEKKICLKTTEADKLTNWLKPVKLDNHVSKAIQFYLHEVATFLLSLDSTISKRSFSLNYSCKLEKDVATHSSVLASRISWMEEPRGLQSMGSQKSQTGLSD